ncbi:DUF2278 family protein [Haliangium sp. UPWRP_2]|uniref:DUF2278 family protein n=1 Tax=Haliangium sp. UPWRP_2 TaxID=1931276 RepID=UPI000B545D5F|nr:DUF2278 family protein [Haliangium sp. UPWRP_2]PSM31346.1 DUF2278 domain-containing protein [Haliangium sp. UPWRP_2]
MNYGVLKGYAKDFRRDDDDDPHSELLMVAKGDKHRIAINVRSSRGPESQRLVEYVILDDVKHPLLDHARTLGEGWTPMGGTNQGVDYIRSNLFRATDMKPLPHTQSGPDNDLFEKVEDLIQHAISANAPVYAFGDKWGPEPSKPDQYFGFGPGNGVHKIHMNQGDRENANAKYQDGALFVEYPSGRTSGLFMKFQNQAWHTDETHGNPLADAPNALPIVPALVGAIAPWRVVPKESPYHLARIVGALVNPQGTDEAHEMVTIYNTSSAVINLKGWKILDAHDREEPLSGTVHPGHALNIVFTGHGARLPNIGGTITLLDPRGLKVDGVSYSRKDGRHEGGAITF